MTRIYMYVHHWLLKGYYLFTAHKKQPKEAETLY